MSETKLFCNGGYEIEIRGNVLVIMKKRNEEIVPIEKIQSFSFKEPGLSTGRIAFKTAQASAGSVALGGGVSVAGGVERVFYFQKRDVETARAIRDAVTGFSNRGAEPVGGTTVSVVEEIRGLKQLLDDGILTEEEFAAKKKQLLGI